MRIVPDEDLERLAVEHGPDSYQASMLSDLRQRRTKDEQVHCFQLGESVNYPPLCAPTCCYASRGAHDLGRQILARTRRSRPGIKSDSCWGQSRRTHWAADRLPARMAARHGAAASIRRSAQVCLFF
jgi:hypothetical protein